MIGTVDSLANVFVNKYWYLLGISPKQNVISQENEEIYVSESLSSLPTDEQTKFFNSFAETFKIPEEHEDGKKYGIDYGFWKKDLKKIFDATRNFRIRDYKESVAKSKELIKIVTQDCCKLNFDREELLGKLEAVDRISYAAAQSRARDTRIKETERFRRLVNNQKTTQLEIGFGLFEMIKNGRFTTRDYLENDDYLSLALQSNNVWVCEEVRDLQYKYVENLFEIAKRWQEEYIKYKKEQHIIDYTDMEEYLLELITNSKYESVQEDIQASYKYLLKKYNIPTLIGDNEFKVSREINLLSSLLSLVVNPADTMARAAIAFLTKEGYGAAEILDRRFEDLSNNKKDSDYFEEIPLIQKLIEKRDNYKSLSVSALVENLIIELDLYNIVKSWPDSDNSVNTFHTVISIAKAYEDHCIQMSLPCTIYGFIDYISTVKIKAAGMSDGVQLFTYHGSKGLEWKNVILVSLEEDILDDTKMISREFYGVHTSHEVEPNADNPYPPMMISVLPWIFGSLKKTPENVQNMIFANSKYSLLKRKIIQEEKRLMYVAMTRPVESLILVSNKDAGLLRLKELGVRAVDSIPAQERADILGIGKNFVIENPCDMEGWKFNTPGSKVIGLCGENKNYRKRDQQPSTCKPSKTVKAEIVYDSGSRITLKSSEEEMNKIGTCLHNIFCVLEQNPTEAQAFEIIKNHEMSLALPDASEILTAWTNLESFMTNKYGAKNATFHELPFKQYYEGQIFTGSIDFIWETSDGGVVLVDFKSYPGSKDDVVNPEHKHYAGIYAGQFECYERALTAAGKKVLAKLVYYHVLGVVVKLD